MRKRQTPADAIPQRVVDKVLTRAVLDADGCLITSQGTGSHGYGQIGWTEDGVEFAGMTHRVVWIALSGPIPEGFDVHHKCFERKCVNVEHLECIPAFENRRRTRGTDWEIGTCKYGHSNELLITIGNKRRCGPCYEVWRMGYRAGIAAEREGRAKSSTQHAA